MSYSRHKRSYTNSFYNRRISINKNIHYVRFDDAIVIGDFNKMKYYYLDSISSVFYTYIISSDSFDIAIKKLEATLKQPKEKFTNELVDWCNDMCARGIFYVK